MNARRLTLSALATALGALAFTSAPAFALKEYVPGISFGSAGSGAGQFTEPAGLAVNDSTALVEGAGDVYVADKGDNRVERFSAAGVFEAQFNGSGAPKPLSAPEYVAVDNSTTGLDSALGNVYVTDNGHHVVDEFTAAGTYVGQLTGTCPAAGTCLANETIPFGELLGVAVSLSGNVWVYDSNGNFDEFSNTRAFMRTVSNTEGESHPGGVALDSEENLYAIKGGAPSAKKFESATGELLAFVVRPASALAVAPANNDLLVDQESRLQLYGPIVESEQPALRTFATQGLADSHGVATNADATTLYASQQAADNVESFNEVALPTVTAPSASEVSNTVEKLSGTVEPEGEAIKECRFEYGLTEAEPGHYEHSVLCAQAPESITGTSANASQTVSGLMPGATYHFRLDVSNEKGTGNSPDATFTMFPVVGGESFSGVSASSAVLHAAVEPGGVPTSYFFEYGPGVGYGFVTPVESAGAGVGGVSVLATVEGLSPGTAYHFRVVASSVDGVLRGGDSVFSTLPVGLLGLPDGRGYELVSPLGNGDASVVPEHGGRAAADGGTVTYAGQSPLAGGNGCGEYHNNGGGLWCGDNQYLAARAGSGWGAVDIQPEGINTAGYQSFSSDLSLGILVSEQALIPGAPTGAGTGNGPTGLYAREAGGVYRLLGENASYAGSTPDGKHILVSQKGRLEEVEPQTGKSYLINVLSEGGPAANAVFGAPPAQNGDLSNVISGDGSRVFWTDLEFGPEQGRIFVHENALSGGGTVPVSEGEALFWTATADGRYVFYTEQGNLYRFDVETEERALLSSDAPTAAGTANLSAATGTARIRVESNILKDVETTSGAFAVGQEIADSHAKIPPGTVITAILGPSELELSRSTGQAEEIEASVVISAGSRELTSLNTTTGHFLPGEELRGRGIQKGTTIEEVTPTALKLSVTVTLNATDVEVFTGGPRVVGVLGTSSDGSYVYFAAGAALAPGAKAQECAPAVESGEPPNNKCNVYVLHDGEAPRLVAVVTARDGGAAGGDWFPFVGSHSSFVSGDGRVLVFKSIEDLTGFDSLGDQEIYSYAYPEPGTAGSGTLVCISCNPSGAPTVHGLPYQFDAELPNSDKADFAPRDLSVSGGRVFFRTVEGLVPQDENGKQDVYEWERAGEGTCAVGGASYSAASGGCLFVLSGGSSTDESYFLDAGENGEDAFIETRADLLPQDKGEVYEVYDVRVGATEPPTEPQCTGAGCQGVPAAPPIFSTPASATITGVDGFPPAASKVIKKKTVKCVKGKKLSKGKCVKQKKSKKTKTKRVSHDRRPSR
jgi:hypothetical protein